MKFFRTFIILTITVVRLRRVIRDQLCSSSTPRLLVLRPANGLHRCQRWWTLLSAACVDILQLVVFETRKIQ